MKSFAPKLLLLLVVFILGGLVGILGYNNFVKNTKIEGFQSITAQDGSWSIEANSSIGSTFLSSFIPGVGSCSINAIHHIDSTTVSFNFIDETRNITVSYDRDGVIKKEDLSSSSDPE